MELSKHNKRLCTASTVDFAKMLRSKKQTKGPIGRRLTNLAISLVIFIACAIAFRAVLRALSTHAPLHDAAVGVSTTPDEEGASAAEPGFEGVEALPVKAVSVDLHAGVEWQQQRLEEIAARVQREGTVLMTVGTKGEASQGGYM